MGLFQGGMPLIGYYPTGLISNYLMKYSAVIVFAIFLVLGLKFIVEAYSAKEETPVCKIGFRCLVAMGIATSIDALGAGVSLRLVGADIILSVLIIGFASFVLSLIGFWTGNKITKIPAKYLEVSGGLILIGLAIKALF